jgi:hypothetical protein
VTIAVVAIAAAAGGVFALARGPRAASSSGSAHGEEVTIATPAAPGPAGSTSTNVGRRVRTTGAPVVAGDAAGADHVAALRLGLASNDEATRIAAVEAAVGATAVETLDDLEKFDLQRDPETAPTVIHAVALLGASAEGKRRDEAATTLAGWLRSEMKREGPDAVGNVSNLVEALGNVGGDGAVEALGAALDRADLALHVETLAVAKLGELGDARARGPVERFAKRVAALPAGEGIDEELRVEAIAAARTTLSKL